MRNQQVLLKSRPHGIPQADNFDIVETDLRDVQEGEILVRNQYLSVEPAMRGWVSAVANYSKPVGLGEVMRAFASGEVVQSRHADFKTGDKVTGLFGWQAYAIVPATSVGRKVLDTDLPLSTSLGILGLNGITAYFGLLDLGQPKADEVVVVSTAAGSVGSAVGQIAKLQGCRTVGITSGAEKRQLCQDVFQFDDVLDYKTETDLPAALSRTAPQGVNVYFDNTAGAISDAVLTNLAVGARIVVCGTASVSSWDPPPMGPRLERHILTKRARMSGFLAFDYMDRQQEALRAIAQWMRAGQLQWREDITDGLHTAPSAIAELYEGRNLGKRLIRLHT